jgi:hypothetical protein
LVSVWSGTHSALCLEYGKHRTPQRIGHLGDLGIDRRIILGWIIKK